MKTLGFALAATVIGGWCLGGIWMAALGGGAFISALQSRPDPVGILMMTGLLACFLLPITSFLWIVIRSKQD